MANNMITRGNSVELRLSLLRDGVAVADLAAAISATFLAVSEETGDTVIEKQLTDMSLNSPETGTITIALSPSDTDIDTGSYDVAIQFTWGAANVLEWRFSRKLFITPGLI